MTECLSVEKISLQTFAGLFPFPPTTYDSAAFCSLNSDKAEEVAAFVLKDKDGIPCTGQIFGLRDGVWRAPFSAPFSVACGNSVDPADFYHGIARMTGSPIRLAWAPECYGIPAPVDCMMTVAVEANFHYPMERFADYKKFLSRSARYNHNHSMRLGLEFSKTEEIGRAYAVILANRRAMGYPLAMSLEQVEKTVAIVPADFFILSFGGVDVATAMVYRVTANAAQLIYWGDIPAARHIKAMNHLAFKIMEWYATYCPGIGLLDLGPASTMGVRNEGLCEFKLSLGCLETPKFILGTER